MKAIFRQVLNLGSVVLAVVWLVLGVQGAGNVFIALLYLNTILTLLVFWAYATGSIEQKNSLSSTFSSARGTYREYFHHAHDLICLVLLAWYGEFWYTTLLMITWVIQTALIHTDPKTEGNNNA